MNHMDELLWSTETFSPSVVEQDGEEILEASTSSYEYAEGADSPYVVPSSACD
jgi:hypothetical protein